MTLVDYELETAYLHVWKYSHCVQDAILSPKDPAQQGPAFFPVKVQIQAAGSFEPNGQRMGIATDELRVCLWKADATVADPKHGDFLSIGEVRYTIKNVRRNYSGSFDLLVQEQLKNS